MFSFSISTKFRRTVVEGIEIVSKMQIVQNKFLKREIGTLGINFQLPIITMANYLLDN